MEFKRENKYLVLKWDDIRKYLSLEDESCLNSVVESIDRKRSLDGKKNNSYVVVNEEEPYAEKVWDLIKEEEERK